MPDSALYWFKNKNQIIDWTLKDIIKCEQYYQISHLAMLYRLKNLNWITDAQFKEFEPNIIHEADKLGYDISLYKESGENQKFSSIGELIRLTQKAFENGKITGGKRKEILSKSYRNDIIYDLRE